LRTAEQTMKRKVKFLLEDGTFMLVVIGRI